ncbi:hypothetical protein QBC33DRAFT_553953 [Phialemonium atrogriseum]|uniref:Uncharacterized protein n=1 Tax=Phialemonium atrogriseum TaxID=1093897 RepID=A0AAJ0CBL9_9PEZI|nr:uncharacterized protein QBC33DRAFT_553953 [Phialemonium atrogriseum]KAK1772503.1 hypothetical protein QBC33DRAFT_553953 [Phialemonium atrogriseum]
MDETECHYADYAWDSTADSGEDQNDHPMDGEFGGLCPEAIESADLFQHPQNDRSSYPVIVAADLFQHPQSYQSSCPTTPASSTFSGSTISPQVVVNGVPHTAGEVRLMAELLTQARQNSELPPSKYPSSNAVSIVEDWNKLRALREARGDPALAPPEAYLNLRVTIAQDMRDRDVRLEQEAEDQRGNHFVNSALAVIQDRGRLAEIVQSAVSKVDGHGANNVPEVDIRAVSEHLQAIVENTMLDSSSQLRSNISRMDGQIDALKAQIDVLTGAANGQLGTLAVAANTIPGTAHGHIYDAMRHALRDVMAEALRTVEFSAQASRSRHPFPALAQTPFQDRPSVGPHHTQGGALGLVALHKDKVTPAIRTRKPRGHRPTRLKEYMGKLFTKKETEDLP